MGKKLPEMLKSAYQKGYKQGSREQTEMVMKVFQMGFCVAMNDALGIGQERFERVRNRAMQIIGNDFVNDPELSYERLVKEYKAITGQTIEETINSGGVKIEN